MFAGCTLQPRSRSCRRLRINGPAWKDKLIVSSPFRELARRFGAQEIVNPSPVALRTGGTASLVRNLSVPCTAPRCRTACSIWCPYFLHHLVRPFKFLAPHPPLQGTPSFLASSAKPAPSTAIWVPALRGLSRKAMKAGSAMLSGEQSVV
ncbi:uncharacterized protein K452DRAFT_114922 [Aplosporella prunicola CBS 121167]|uniref:Uncharacterized protein n=1 Tax=Aplosporella prunicola CBS 121167 TaxID=1176127 RepID=A0A6A6AYK2_9PEZI|nr:uncharacterized protein K452DRAFT_114922 [Aplosporella prunicola CBS 121167]KAF2137012.1 hypothetical protein K452DRAFT_114922 [Aplosporella prunicola CBS 121167]